MARPTRRTPAPTQPVAHEPAPEQQEALAAKVPTGSTLAKALHALWRGEPIVTIKSPPGAGKTTLVVTAADVLSFDRRFSVVLACPTIQACESIARRIGEVAPDEVMLHGGSFRRAIPGVLVPSADEMSTSKAQDRARIVVSTVAACRVRSPRCDIIVFDEAYQTTFTDAAAAADGAQQIFMVGDPGQIGPPITADTTFWDHHQVAPHHRAPDGFERSFPGSNVILNLSSSYRLGAESVHAISGLYEFGFGSARPPISVEGLREVEMVPAPVLDRVGDPRLLDVVAKRAASMVGRTLRTPQGERPLAPEDIAVLAARNEQTSGLAALLSASGLDRVTVGTADRLQGAQYAAVVALDPFAGSPQGSAHSASLGRLCVMASRHYAHLSWVASPDWPTVIANAPMEADERRRHLQVRTLMAQRQASTSPTSW